MSFRDYLKEHLDADDLRNIARNGADGGFNGLIWSKDMMECFQENESEILDLWGEMGGADLPSITEHGLSGMVDRLVWGAAEILAEELAEEMEEEAEEEETKEA